MPRYIFFALMAISIIEGTLGFRSEWPRENLGRDIELILFAFLPLALWSPLFIPLRSRPTFLNVALTTWALILTLNCLALRLLLNNDIKGLLWLALHFWWAILGICFWLVIAFKHKSRAA